MPNVVAYGQQNATLIVCAFVLSHNYLPNCLTFFKLNFIMKKLIFALALSLTAFSLSAANAALSKTLTNVKEGKTTDECTVTDYFYDDNGDLVCSVSSTSATCGQAAENVQAAEDMCACDWRKQTNSESWQRIATCYYYDSGGDFTNSRKYFGNLWASSWKVEVVGDMHVC